jgi:hypothetical protein
MSDSTNPPPPPRLRAPSLRITALLAAVMLAVGVAVGAAIGPAPTASLGQGLPLGVLLPRLLASLEAQRASHAATAAAPAVEAAAPAKRKRRRKRARLAAGAQTTTTPTSTSETTTPNSATPKPAAKKVALPAITHVWLIELAGSTFEAALAAPTTAAYLDTEATPAGTLLSSWSSLDASAFASDAAQLASTPPQVLDTIIQPPCPETTAGAQCLAGTPGALTAASEFLQQTLPTITSTATYRESGLVVITFASITAGAATGLPAGSTSATTTSQPPAGALLISPFVTAGKRSTAAFNPSSPTRSLEGLLHK